MLYYIIPPIIIILSFSVLVFMLFKKADGAAEGLIDISEKPEKKKGVLIAVVSGFFLKLLERIMQRSKLLSLKIHNLSNTMFHAIKRKREQQQLEKHTELVSQEPTIPSYSKPQQLDKKPVQMSDEPPVIVRRSRTEIFARPSAIEPAAQKLQKTPIAAEPAKEKMEEVLIKRIAINPRDIEAYERLGDYYMEVENLTDSLECFRQVLKLSPVHHKAKMRIRKIERLLK